MGKQVWCFVAGLLIVLASGLALATGAAAQAVVQVEPATLRADLGGTVSIYAQGGPTFTTTNTVRLVGYGLLPTTYVNATALQATVPAGLEAGSQTIEVLDAAGTAVGVGYLTLARPPAPTATARPPETLPPGRPVLIIRSYNTDPPQVKPGQEFTVTVEIYNNGNRTGQGVLVTFLGGTLLPVGPNGHAVAAIHCNQAELISQRMRVPAATGSGIQQLQVHIAASDFEGTYYEFPQSVLVEVVGGSSGAAPTGKPKVLIEDAWTEPAMVVPGTGFTLTLRLANRGSRTAVNTIVGADATVTLPVRGGGTVSVDTIRIDEVVTVTLPLLLQSGQEGGARGLKIALEYGDYSGGGYADQLTVQIDVDAGLASRPQLLIESYRTAPEQISPGDGFTLTLHLANTGGGAAQRIALALGGEEGEKLGPFLTLQGSNLSFVSYLEAGASREIDLRLSVAANAETRAHSLPIALAYDTAGGTREKSTQQVSLLVRRRPQFKVSFYRPLEYVVAGQPFVLPVELLSTSLARFTIPTLEITGEQLEFLGESSTYVGALDPGGSWTLDATAIAAAPGPAEVVVRVHYLDDLNQTQVISQSFIVEVASPPDEPDPGSPGEQPGEQPPTAWEILLQVLKGLLGLGS